VKLANRRAGQPTSPFPYSRYALNGTNFYPSSRAQNTVWHLFEDERRRLKISRKSRSVNLVQDRLSPGIAIPPPTPSAAFDSHCWTQ
jgi:hypothetical protein